MSDDLRSFEVLSHFTKAQLGQLDGTAEKRKLPPDTTVFLEGHDDSEVYLLQRGEVRAHRHTPYGDFELGAIGAGSMFGEQSFVDGLGRTTGVETHTDAELLVLDPPSLRAVAEIDPAFKQALYWAFWKSLSEKLRSANRRLLDFFDGERSDVEIPHEILHMPTETTKLDLAAKRSVFEEQKLSGMEINFLASLSKEERFDGGQYIFRQGDPADEMYIVVEGQVLISTQVPGAGEEALCFLDRGDFFGEMALIDGRPRSADAQAHPEKGALVLGIPGEVLQGILDSRRVSSVGLLENLCRMISKRLRKIDEKLVGWFLVAAADPKTRPMLMSLASQYRW